jgi:hypothetical protein
MSPANANFKTAVGENVCFCYFARQHDCVVQWQGMTQSPKAQLPRALCGRAEHCQWIGGNAKARKTVVFDQAEYRVA